MLTSFENLVFVQPISKRSENPKKKHYPPYLGKWNKSRKVKLRNVIVSRKLWQSSIENQPSNVELETRDTRDTDYGYNT